MRSHLIFLMSLFAASLAQGMPPWEHVTTTDDGISVKARIDKKKLEGETLAKGLIQAPIAKVWKLLGDFDAYFKFMPYMQTSRVVRRNKQHVWQYCRTDTPVVSDRDYTLKFTFIKPALPAPWQLNYQVDNSAGPSPVDGVVRVSLATGGWTLKSVQGGKATHITYRLRTHPGGSIPLWMAHLGNKRAIPDIIRAARDEVGRR
jgi:uncharacterized protein YndB with AHSA1/START domain